MKPIFKQFIPRRLGNYEYRLMQANDFDQVVDITSRAFAHNEPIMSGYNVKIDEIRDYLYRISEYVIGNVLSIVAVDPKNSMIVGSRICGDYNQQPQNIKCSTELQQQFDWFNRVGCKLYANHIIPRGSNLVYHLYLGAIHEQYSGQGIIRNISVLNEEVAMLNGFEYCLSEASSPRTQHIYKSLGYDCVHFDAYKDIVQLMGNPQVDMNKLTSQFKGNNIPGQMIMLKKIR